MPTYDYECPACAARESRFFPMADFDVTVHCSKCSRPMTKVFLSAPLGVVQPTYQPYRCPITEKVIDGRKAHQENLARHGCRVLETGEKEAADRRRAESEAALDRGVEETVEREIALMPTEKKERLAAELGAGTTATVERH